MMDGWDWFWGTLMMVLFWGCLVAVIVFAVRAGGGSRNTSGGSGERTPATPDAKTVLETRYAKGEISREEFEERRRVLDPAAR